MKYRQQHYLMIIAAACALKLLYWSMSIAEYRIFPDSFSADYPVNERTFIANDAIWYLNIAKWGYRDIQKEVDLGCCTSDCFQQSEYAFFPLFPWSIQAAQWVTGFSFEVSSIIWSSLLSLFMFLCFYRLALHYSKHEQTALYTTLFFMLFPFHYFFSMVYTESLFLVLLLMTLLAIIERRYLLVVLSYGLLVLCRPNGIAMLLPLFVFILEERREQYGRYYSLATLKSILSDTAILIPGVLVFMMYCFYLYQKTGFALAFVKAQAGWCKETLFPLWHLFRSGAIHAQVNSVYTLLFLVLGVYITWRRRMRLNYMIILWMGMLIPLSSSIVSMPRYIAALFPFFLWLGVKLPKDRRVVVIFITLLVMQLATYHFWIRNPNLLGL